MSNVQGLGRRTFLHNAGVAAILGAVSPAAAAKAAEKAAAAVTPNGRYDFDSVLNRFGTDCVKFDKQIKAYGKDSIAVGMGIADMDFKVAPVITRALQERLQHENWGYLDLPRSFLEGIAAWNKRRHGIDVDPDTIVAACGVHPGVIAALQTFS